MSEEKQYAPRDIIELGPLYLRHVSAMTGEGLHSKADIAAELAWRDAEIARLQQGFYGRMAAKYCRERDAAWAELRRIRELIKANKEEATEDEAMRVLLDLAVLRELQHAAHNFKVMFELEGLTSGDCIAAREHLFDVLRNLK